MILRNLFIFSGFYFVFRSGFVLLERFGGCNEIMDLKMFWSLGGGLLEFIVGCCLFSIVELVR